MGKQHIRSKLIGAAPDAVLLPACDLEAIARIYHPTEIDDEALIRKLKAIRRMHPRLLDLRDLPDGDLCPAVEAGLSAEGRSLVSAFVAGQLLAHRRVLEIARAQTVDCLGHWSQFAHPAWSSPSDED